MGLGRGERRDKIDGASGPSLAPAELSMTLPVNALRAEKVKKTLGLPACRRNSSVSRLMRSSRCAFEMRRFGGA